MLCRRHWMMLIFCVRLLRCPFYYTRQCEGLNKRNGQQVRLSRFFLFYKPILIDTGEGSLWCNVCYDTTQIIRAIADGLHFGSHYRLQWRWTGICN